MKVILLADIPKVGNKYEVKDFKEGYAQNVLLAKGLACLATKAELAKLEDRKRVAQKKKEEEDKTFSNLINSVGSKVITIKAKANEKGHLFKAVGPRDVVDAIKNMTGVEIDEKSLTMEHIKNLGSHTVSIKKGDKKGECQILIKGADEDADVRAYELAIKIGADKLIFITTSDGIYNNEQALLHQLDIASAKNIADTSVIKGFMKHKLLLAIKACEEGIKRVHFISGHRHRENSLIKELFSTEGVGTMISANIYQNCRKANNDDIAEIIRILAQDSFYHRADIKYISTNINEFYVYAIDSDIHGCMKLVHSVETETLIIQTMAVQGILDDYDTTIKMAEAAISEAKNLCCKQLSVDIKQCPTWMIMDPAFYRLGFEQTPDTKIWSINL